MSSDRLRFLTSVVASALLLATSVRAETPLADVIEPRPPTPIEEALIQRDCDALRLRADGLGTHDQCLDDRLASLRADFGYDLGRLSASERRKLDATCSSGRPEGREAYLDCLDVGLRSLRDRARASNPASKNAAAPLRASATGAPTLPAPAARKVFRFSLLLAFALGVPILIAGGAFFVLRRPSSARRCRTCGAELGDASDLCAACRHQAAEALRQAAAERAMPPQVPPSDERHQRGEEADALPPAAAAGTLAAGDDEARVNTSSTG